uniref:IS3 family transposase n=1 Tax=Streptomyces corallincola TaxID=2851888 RepID=UPI0027E34F8D|nr:IS3 family transposase [Streptomyces corallincola]
MDTWRLARPVRKARADQGEGRPGELTTQEREEPRRLRRQNAEQAKTIEVLRKASRGLLRERKRSANDTYAFIEAGKTTHGFAFLRRLLKVARSCFYAWLAAQKTRAAGQAADASLTQEITVIHFASRETYGVPRVHAELRRLGPPVNHKRVARLMREHGIQGAHRRRSLTRPDRKARPAPDLIGRDVHADIPGTKLVGDITFREVVGYDMADHHRAELVVDALDMAHGRAGLKPGRVIHSDRGSECTSGQFRDHIRELVLRQSCGRTGSCFDNAAAESFWVLLKEEIGTRIWPDRATARAGTRPSATSPQPRPGSGIDTPSRHDHRVSEITGKLQVAVHDGIVELTGRMPSATLARLVAEGEEISDVVEVKNLLTAA